jgi:hypothetical protein
MEDVNSMLEDKISDALRKALKLEEAPTLEEMKAFRDELHSEWTQGEGNEDGLDGQQDEEERLYFQDFPVYAPENKWVVKTGSAPADCDSAVDTLVPLEISVKVRPARNTEKCKKQAERQVRFAKGIINSWREGEDKLRAVATDMVMRRVGVARILYDKSLWPDPPKGLSGEDLDYWEAVHRSKIPIVMEVRNPRYTRWRESGDRGELLGVVETYKTTVLEARRRFESFPAARTILRTLKPNDTVIVDDIWYLKWRSVLIDDKPIFPFGTGKRKGVVPHLYPEIPYALAPFRKLTFENPGRRYRGPLSNSRNLYVNECQALTMQVWMMALNAWRTMVGWTKDGRPISVVPGTYVQIDQRIGEYLEQLKGEPVPDVIAQTASIFDGFIQRNGTSQGPRSVQGTRSAEQVWAIQSQRLVKLESAKQSLVTFIDRCLRLSAMIAQHMHKDKLTLPVPGKDQEGNDYGEVTIDPQRDIDGYWDAFEVTTGKRIDPAVLSQMQALSQLAMGGWMPYVDSVEMSGATDTPQEWEDKLLLQKVNNLPMMAEVAALKLAERWFEEGRDSQEYQMLLQRVMGQQGAGAQTGGPGQTPAGTGQMVGMPHGGGDVASNPMPSPFGGGAPQPNAQNGME